MQNKIVLSQTVTEAATPEFFQCRHVRASGRRCQRPALRGERFCHTHYSSRRPIPHPGPRYPDADRDPFALPAIEDRASIQLALSQVLARIAANDLDPKRAGLLLYGLQIASRTIARSEPREARPGLPETEPLEGLVHDPDHGLLAPVTPWDPELAYNEETGRRRGKSFAQELYEELTAPEPRPDPLDVHDDGRSDVDDADPAGSSGSPIPRPAGVGSSNSGIGSQAPGPLAGPDNSSGAGQSTGQNTNRLGQMEAAAAHPAKPAVQVTSILLPTLRAVAAAGLEMEHNYMIQNILFGKTMPRGQSSGKGNPPPAPGI